jgi:uncharacterized membrane protein
VSKSLNEAHCSYKLKHNQVIISVRLLKEERKFVRFDCHKSGSLFCLVFFLIFLLIYNTPQTTCDKVLNFVSLLFTMYLGFYCTMYNIYCHLRAPDGLDKIIRHSKYHKRSVSHHLKLGIIR